MWVNFNAHCASCVPTTGYVRKGKRGELCGIYSEAVHPGFCTCCYSRKLLPPAVLKLHPLAVIRVSSSHLRFSSSTHLPFFAQAPPTCGSQAPPTCCSSPKLHPLAVLRLSSSHLRVSGLQRLSTWSHYMELSFLALPIEGV